MILTHKGIVSILVFVVVACGCGLPRPSDPAPFDCSAIDRAAERFPEECGEDAGEVDAGTEDTGGEDAP
jgi:hypothetical protein